MNTKIDSTDTVNDEALEMVAGGARQTFPFPFVQPTRTISLDGPNSRGFATGNGMGATKVEFSSYVTTGGTRRK